MTDSAHNDDPENDNLDLEELASIFYDEMRARARRLMGAGADISIDPTELVHEAYLKLMKKRGATEVHDRSHFLRLATKVLRQVLVDRFRRKSAAGRPKESVDFNLDQMAKQFNERAINLSALDRQLEVLAKDNPQMAHAIELQFFGGASLAEISEIIGMPPRTLQRKLKDTKAWLHGRITGDQD